MLGDFRDVVQAFELRDVLGQLGVRNVASSKLARLQSANSRELGVTEVGIAKIGELEVC